MCGLFCIKFVSDNIPVEAVQGKRVLEVAAYDVNGSCRAGLTEHQPFLYLGVDMRLGPGVDMMVNVYELESHFGFETQDVVINTEMLEHVVDWKEAINNMKNVLKVGGYLALTTRSPGFGYHGFPEDWWRFTLDDMRHIFSDCRIVALASDPEPGVGIVVQKIQSEVQDLRQFEVMQMPQPPHLQQSLPSLPSDMRLCVPRYPKRSFKIM